MPVFLSCLSKNEQSVWFFFLTFVKNAIVVCGWHRAACLCQRPCTTKLTDIRQHRCVSTFSRKLAWLVGGNVNADMMERPRSHRFSCLFLFGLVCGCGSVSSLFFLTRAFAVYQTVGCFCLFSLAATLHGRKRNATGVTSSIFAGKHEKTHSFPFLGPTSQ
jgi:hypothetical protein